MINTVSPVELNQSTKEIAKDVAVITELSVEGKHEKITIIATTNSTVPCFTKAKEHLKEDAMTVISEAYKTKNYQYMQLVVICNQQIL